MCASHLYSRTPTDDVSLDIITIVVIIIIIIIFLPSHPLIGSFGLSPKKAVPDMHRHHHHRWSLALHGGTSNVPARRDEAAQMYGAALGEALEIGSSILASGGSALDAVTKVVVNMEDNPLFNAGKGAVTNAEGQHRLEASIMDGTGLRAGAVAGLSTVKNPVLLARLVMERTHDIVLISDGAEAFATQQKVERVPQSYFGAAEGGKCPGPKTAKRSHPGQTVGCVALDAQGCLAAATSTGGLHNKRRGRMTDSSIIGAGNYAKEGVCAVSATGAGEEFIRHSVASRICCVMEYGGLSLREATHKVIFCDLRKGDGGVIAVDGRGNVSMVFNTTGGMLRAMATSLGDKCIRTLSPPPPREFW